MKQFLLGVAICLSVSFPVLSQHYQPNWESLDKRPIPDWFQQAKFGIFIHWGVYAVPGWSTKGNYAEWYQQGLETTDSARKQFHRAKFGNRTYYELANDFKAELFKPDEWARLFEKSGAKYIVLTSKHHDGFTLWPSKEANKTWGFPWNATAIGPKRDLLGELFAAVRKTSVHAGMYYSLYEWFNPLWKTNREKFVEEHTWPQMKDLINNYQPDVFWTDGDWDASAETWKSQQFLAWLYNESPVKDKIVVNDRWGAGIRFKHGGIYTPEYQPDLDFEDHYWEESRGMGYSYGYNREEDAWDYNSTQSLIIALIDKVSRGGNFLLDIGPDEHGKIPPIMQERLLEMGNWLQVNGEAIYGTRRWKQTTQWSAGRRDYKGGNEHAAGDWKTGGDLMLKLTVDPEPGYAVKELFYTYNEQTNNLYALFPRYPSSKELHLKGIRLPSGTTIELLGYRGPIRWRQEADEVLVQLPDYDPYVFTTPEAFALKIARFGRFTAKPALSVRYEAGATEPTVEIKAADGADVFYTLNGSEPSRESQPYTRPFRVTQNALLKAKAFSATADPSATTEASLEVYSWQSAPRRKATKPGLQYRVYELEKPQSVTALRNTPPVKSGIQAAIDLKPLTRKEQAGIRFDGLIKIDADDIYTFYLSSDDGSRLEIEGKTIIDHDGLHGADTKQASIALKKGYYRIGLDFFQATGGIGLNLFYSSSRFAKMPVPAKAFFQVPASGR